MLLIYKKEPFSNNQCFQNTTEKKAEKNNSLLHKIYLTIPIMPTSKPSSAASGVSTQQLDDTAGSLSFNNNNNNQVDVNSPFYIINQALSTKDQEDFFQAFWHYFMYTSSAVPQTITVKELGYIFRAFGQKVPEKELRQLMDTYGTKLGASFHHHHENQNNINRRNSVVGANHLKKQTSFIDGGADNSSNSLAGKNQQQQQAPPPPTTSRQGSRPSTVSLHQGGGGGGAANFGSGVFTNINNNQNLPLTNNSQSSTAVSTQSTFLTWQQFLLLMANKLKSDDSESALGDAFDVFDVKKQGYVLSKELRQFMTLLGDSRLSEDEVEKMIQEADVDGDGTIDKDEFIKMLQK